MHTTTKQMYFYNLPTAVWFQVSSQKCTLLQGISKYAIVIVQVHNI